MHPRIASEPSQQKVEVFISVMRSLTISVKCLNMFGKDVAKKEEEPTDLISLIKSRINIGGVRLMISVTGSQEPTYVSDFFCSVERFS